MSEGPDVKRSCARVRARLPRLADDTLPGWRRRLVQRHLDRCEGCTVELERQRAVTEGLRELGDAVPAAEPAPPDDLLDEILEDIDHPGIRGRVARPARGALSGARPELSITAVLLTALVAYLTWRLARRLAAGTPEPGAR